MGHYPNILTVADNIAWYDDSRTSTEVSRDQNIDWRGCSDGLRMILDHFLMFYLLLNYNFTRNTTIILETEIFAKNVDFRQK